MTISMDEQVMWDAYTCAAFRALVDAIIPPTCRQHAAGEVEYAAGAVQLHVDQFVRREIDHSQFVPAGEKETPVPLSRSTAQLLNMGAEALIRKGLARLPLPLRLSPETCLFAVLSRENRLQALELLDRVEISLHRAPPPYQNNPAMIQTMVDTLNQLTMFGYYTEWLRHETLRLSSPSSGLDASCPSVWRLIGYPGPAFGYRDFRGFIMTGKGETPHD
ncbi:hypothetical protein [Bacillus sp. 3255]|uniref:hypothetical protein n=1 Tax=Bacillus sp. 3255 TaxID=2817904 RepID=UPI0028640746|nr:hypothetical protein [Bacillus sp. 3255]MDR6879241.1 hypothetical protein [Bacillus sp. 3255]